MNFPVIKGASYALIHVPDMVLHQGTTQESERLKNPESEHLKALPKHLRSYREVIAYPPNQVFIGNKEPEELREIEQPWYQHPVEGAGSDGKFGEILPEEEFIGLMRVVDTFDLVYLEAGFQAEVKKKLASHRLFGDLADLDRLDHDSASPEDIEQMVAAGAEGIYCQGKLVGCVKAAHEFDQNLGARVLFENLVNKASAVVALKELLAKTDLKANEVEYLIECSEEACGDMNQRGGGNFAKAIGEICGCSQATGSDTRGFCAAPAHAIIEAAALVQAGIYKQVVVLAGGSSAKLGMNSRDHVKKGIPALEDVLGAFAVHIAANDGVSPVIRTDMIGRHLIGSGASPQAVIQAIVFDPIEKAGWKVSAIDRFAPELQNPEITEPAGAGNVPLANYKMIAALGVKKGAYERAQLMAAVNSFGLPGYAPTQGHIPSGIPYLGFAREKIMRGEIKRVMVIGKGSLFLGRLTNLFDGVSFIVEKNSGKQETGVNQEQVRQMVAEAMRKLADSLAGGDER